MSILLPLEVNPECLNKLHDQLKVSCTYKDVLSFEAEILKTLPGRVLAVFLALPLSQQHEEFRKKQAEEMKDKEPNPNVYFLKQTLENSCGIIAIIHAVANNLTEFSFGPGSNLKSFIDKTATSTPDQRAAFLAGYKELLLDHNAIAAETLCRPDGDAHFHVVMFTAVDGHLCELDGLTEKPIDHGATSENTFLEDIAKVCKQYTEREKNDVRFSAVALTKDA